MPPFSFIKKLIKPSKKPRRFSLGNTGKPGIPRAGEDIVKGRHLERPPYATKETKRAMKEIWDSVQVPQDKLAKPEDQPPSLRSPFGAMSQERRKVLVQPLDTSLDNNLRVIMDLFHLPRNSGLQIREIEQKTRRGPVRMAILYMPGLVDAASLRRNILSPLVRLNILPDPVEFTIDTIFHLIAETQLIRVSEFTPVLTSLVEGECVIMIDGEKEAVVADTRSIEHRQVEESPTEAVVRGPHEGFVETLRVNSAMIRRRLATPDLVTERHYVGGRSHTPVEIVYVEGVVNPKLIEEVRRLIDSGRAGLKPSSAGFWEYLSKPTLNPFPRHIATERPDRVAAMVAEGHVAVIDDSPTALLYPATLWGLMHSAEDYYVHPVPATMLRIARYIALFVTIYASALYVAVVTFHPEMIPTELMFAIASAREVVPFPAGLEIALMEIAFELIREAGVRVPAVIGPTIGIVGAVVLGQAAVQANIVSPILVVIVAIAALGSFAIPNYDLSLFARVMKFVMIGAAMLFGIPGVTLASVAMVASIMSARSMGVPMLAPLIPSWRRNADLVVRAPLAKLKWRPGYLRPQEERIAPERSDGGLSPENPPPDAGANKEKNSVQQ